MSRYIPMPAYIDMMPVDISFVFKDEKPAGKHGFLKAVGEEFRFEDGTLGKFWGVNINGGANFPTHDYAEKFASRLAQAGCNLVRLHQLDAEWGIPNIFAFSRGQRVTTTRKLDPRSMDRLDYLVYCLKEQGIYCYLDMMTYRKFKEGDGVIDADKLPDVGKPYNMINRHLIELQKEYATNLWTHYNPYTKLQYKDDPVFVMSELIAECDLFMDSVSSTWYYQLPEYYDKEYRGVFKEWLDKNGIEYDWENCNMYANDETLIAFKLEKTTSFLAEMYDHMRAIGVKIPIAGTNWGNPGDNATKSHMAMDYTDNHLYTYDWKWANNERICKNAHLDDSLFRWGSRSAIAGKPFYLSEWDMPWPNSYRAEGAIHYAAVCALQRWSGACIHTYSYGTRLEDMKVLGRELSSPIMGVPYREGIFATWNDPAKFGLFYHAALITRRGDVDPAVKKIAYTPSSPFKSCYQALKSAFNHHQMRIHFGEDIPEGYDMRVLDNETVPVAENANPNLVISDNGQVWWDKAKELRGVDTARTKAFYGMLGKGYNCGSTGKYRRPKHMMNGLEIQCATDFGVIALSSLTDDPIETSNNILLSAIGRARNTDQVFDGEKMLDVGKPPIMAEVIDAYVRVKNIHGTKMQIWGVNAEGMYAGRLPATYDEEGYLNFRIGDENNPACYYLIVKE